MSRARAKQLIEEQLKELNGLRNGNPRDAHFKHWRQATLTAIQRIWEGDAVYSDRFRRIPFSSTLPNPDAHTVRETYARGCIEAAGLLKGYLEELVKAPAPPPVADPKPAEVSSEEPEAPQPRASSAPGNGGRKQKKEKREPHNVQFDPGQFAAELEASVGGTPPPPSRPANPKTTRGSKAVPSEGFDLASLGAEFEALSGTDEDDDTATPFVPPTPIVGRTPAPSPIGSRPKSHEVFVPTADVDEETVEIPNLDAMFGDADTEEQPTDDDTPEPDEDLFRDSPVFTAGARLAESPGNTSRKPAGSRATEPPRETPREHADEPMREMPRAESPRTSESPRESSRTSAPPPVPMQRQEEIEVFSTLAASTLATIAADLHRFGVPEEDRAEARDQLLVIARGIDTGEMAWLDLQTALHYAIDRPRLARRVLPLLVPYLDEAA